MGSWELTESSGLLDDADIEITGAEFNYDAEYDDGDTLILILSGTSNQEGWEDFTQFLSIGKGWESPDQGKTAIGRDNFNKNSQYGRWIQGAIDSGAGDVIQGRGFPDVAAIWLGLKFHVKRVDVDYGGEIGVRSVLTPVAFNGESGKAEAPVGNTAGATQVAEAPATPVAEVEAPVSTPATPASNGSDAVLRAQVMALKTAPNHDAFIEEVITKFPEVQQDAELFAEVVNPDGIYAS